MALQPYQLHPNSRVSLDDNEGYLASAADILYIVHDDGSVTTTTRTHLTENGVAVVSQEQQAATADREQQLEAELESVRRERESQGARQPEPTADTE